MYYTWQELKIGLLFVLTFLSSVLLEIFGPSAEKIVNEHIFKRPCIFSGPCDIYEQVRPTADQIHDKKTTCYGGKHTFAAALNGKASLLRAGLILKTCKALLANDKTYDYLRSRVKSDSDDDSVKRAFHLFNPLEKIDDKLVAKFRSLQKHFWSSSKKWKAVFLTLCIDPGWQIL